MRKNTKRALTLLLTLVLCLGLLPMTAMAEESSPRDPVAGPFWLTFLAAGGKFSDGGEGMTLMTTDGPDEGVKHRVQFPTENPVREGYSFAGWYLQGVPNEPAPQYVTADAVFEAKWEDQTKLDPNTHLYRLILDPNGGSLPAGAEKVVYLDASNTLRQELPVPTRSGYTFLGWYSGYSFYPVKAGDTFTDYQTPLTAKWSKIRTSKITPSLTASPAKIEAGAEKIEIILSCATSGVSLDWRPLERVVAPARGSDLEAAVKGLLTGNFSDVGLKLTEVFYQGGESGYSDNAYPYELYPEGVCPAGGLVLTLEGTSKMAGTLVLQLSGKNFLEFVPAGSSTVLDASSDQIFNDAQVKIPVGSPNPNGPFTVKFDLNYKNPPKAEIPKDQTIQKGGTVALPDGSKLTCPFLTHEFYAWCVRGEGGKLYPWRESAGVTADMTLYAGWVKKGTVVKDGEAVPDTSGQSAQRQPTQPSTPAAPKFTDVVATSPFAPAIAWAVEKGITNGKTATTFGPGEPCTRAQIVTFLYRAAGSPEPKNMEAEYADVTNAGAYYYKAIQWAAEMGMEESGTFAPDKPCTRGQAMYFIWKARAGTSSAGSAPHFTDLSRDSLYYDAVLWAVGQGVTNGTGDGTTFSPDNPCTRGQIVTFLYRAYEK